MKLTYRVILLFVVGVAISCKSENKQNDSDIEKIDFVFEHDKEQFDFQTMIDTLFEPIVLETTKECVIGEVSTIALRRDTIIIGDTKTKSVYLFDNRGKYLSKINRVGRGPQEYIDMTDLFISEDHIYVMDNNQFKVCCYDFRGNHIFSFNSKEGVCIGAKDGKLLVGTTWGGGALWDDCFVAEFDEFGTMTNSFIKKSIDDVHRDNIHYKYFIKTQNGLDFLLPSKNIVYRYVESCLNPSYKIDFADKAMPESIAKKGLVYCIKNNVYEKYTSGVQKIFEAGQYRFICANYSSGDYTLVYNINTKNNICTYFHGCNINGFNFSFMNFREDKDYLCYYVNGDVLCKLRDNVWKKNFPDGLCQKFNSLSQNMNLTDNGLILIMKMK